MPFSVKSKRPMTTGRFAFSPVALLACLLSLLPLPACKEKGSPLPQFPVEIHRYEKALMELDTSHIQNGLEQIAPRFGLYLQGADLSDTINLLRIKYFIQDPVVKQAYRKIESTYSDWEKTSAGLSLLFARIRSLFPDFRDPEVYTYISYYDFANRVLYLDSVLSIAIDLYADGNEKAMDEIGIPRYLSRRLDSRYLLPDAAKVIGSALMPPMEKSTLLDYMVSDGKLIYFMQEVLPQAEPALLLAYTDEEYLWCESHEREVWQYLVQQNLLFETDPLRFRYFVNEGPFNPLLQGAPARLSQFIGFQIVERYMRKSGKNWESLLKEEPLAILRESGYKP